MMRNMFPKYSGRGARYFSTSLSSSSSTLKRVWDEQSTSRLFIAFFGGYLGWSYLNLYKRRVLSQKIYRMIDEHAKYSEEVWDRYYRFHKGEYDEKTTLDDSSNKTNVDNPRYVILTQVHKNNIYGKEIPKKKEPWINELELELISQKEQLATQKENAAMASKLSELAAVQADVLYWTRLMQALHPGFIPSSQRPLNPDGTINMEDDFNFPP